MRKVLLLALLLAGCRDSLYESSSGSTGGATSGTTGSQSQPITISGTRHAYDVMFVVDRSGSMSDSADGTASSVCPSAGQQNLNCKWDQLLNLMNGQNGFLNSLANALTYASGEPPQFGLITFGGYSGGSTVQDSCTTGLLQAPLGEADPTQLQSIQTTLDGINPSGGTPTAATLSLASGAFPNDGHDHYVVLLTDGAPNCDANLPATAENCDPSGPRCVSAGGCYGQSGAPYGCLDDDATVVAVGGLSNLGITTFVIGFGADFSDTANPGAQTMDRMAEAGGAPRTDSTGAPLEPAFYQALSAADLESAFNAVGSNVQGHCRFSLASAAPASFTALSLQASGKTAGVAPKNVFLSGDRLTALVVDDAACTEVVGSPVQFVFTP